MIDVLALNNNLTRLVSLLKSAGLADKSAGLADELQGQGPFTIFAPNDEAFRSMRKDTLKELEEDPELLKIFLRNHVSKGNFGGESRWFLLRLCFCASALPFSIVVPNSGVTCCSLIKHGSYMGGDSIRIPSLASHGKAMINDHEI